MYRILFKGRDLEPMFVDDDKGKKIWEAWVDDKKARMVVGNTAFYTGDIRRINRIEKSEAEQARSVEPLEDEYLGFRRNMLALPIEKRAAILRIPKLVWRAHATGEMPETVKTEIRKRQLAYFKEHPNCIYANPKVYKDLIEQKKFVKETDTFKPISNILPAATMRLIQEIIRTDLQYSVR